MLLVLNVTLMADVNNRPVYKERGAKQNTLNDGRGSSIGGISFAPVAVGAGAVTTVHKYSEHKSKQRPSLLPKHEKGEARRKKDQRGEKKDKNGSYEPYQKKRNNKNNEPK